MDASETLNMLRISQSQFTNQDVATSWQH